jgi:cysteine synthase A
LLSPGGLIIEPTSGNTGIGLALVAAVKGYRLILTMPDTMSVERRRLLAAYGAEVVLTPGAEGMSGAIEKAKSLQEENPGSFIPQQFENPANSYAHFTSTGPEIFADLDGEVDCFVATVGTSGTLSGTSRYLRSKCKKLHVVAVEPAASPMLSEGKSGAHKIQGIGANFVPPILDKSDYNEIITVADETAIALSKDAAVKEGLLVGISSGAALAAAIEVGKRDDFAGKNIVVLLPDSGERYLA